MDWDVLVIGAGAAGLLAAARAAEGGKRTLLLEKNKMVGVKILMSGGTRCNLTQNTDRRGIVDAFGKPGRFLHSALAALGPAELVALVEAEGVATKVEPTGKIFPVSDKAADIQQAFMRRLSRSGAVLASDEPVVGIERYDHGFRVMTVGKRYQARKLILTTGGMSYPGSGTTGDGYAWAAALGHSIVPPRPALTPIATHCEWVRKLQGITIPDAGLSIVEPKSSSKPLKQDRGSLLLAHFGLSGPLALDASRVVSGHARPSELMVLLDFLPNEIEAALDETLKQASLDKGRHRLSSLFTDRLPLRLVEALLVQAGQQPDRKAAELSRGDRQRIGESIKRQPIPVAGTLGFKKAEVTAGGVSLDEVNSKSMESKLVPGLFFAGEILDLDGPIGGYNFQAAFSTGYLAGTSV